MRIAVPKWAYLKSRLSKPSTAHVATSAFSKRVHERLAVSQFLVRSSEKSSDRAIKSRWHLLPARLALAVRSPFVKQMRTRSWARCRLRLPLVVARCSYVPFTIGSQQKSCRYIRFYDHLRIVRPVEKVTRSPPSLPLRGSGLFCIHEDVTSRRLNSVRRDNFLSRRQRGDT